MNQCTCSECENEAIVGLSLCEDHAQECTCECPDCRRRGVHYCHEEDGSDYGELCPSETALDYRKLSYDGQAWIEDLMGSADETGFPDIDPTQMTEEERDKLANYLDHDDGSLSAKVLEFSRSIAAEVREL